ncbi:MAG TPA: hypothetical protein VFA35_09385, partial [Burkholderiaceae bacterium]|nr:hypothetical protein [Burkholderiaceae bacterium]
MSQPPALLMIASFAVGAALLWLSAELGVAAGMRSPRLARPLFAIAVGLGAGALWWPANALRVPDVAVVSTQGFLWLSSWPACLLLAGLAGAAGALWNRGERAWAMLATAGLPIAAYLHVVFGAPDWLGVGALTLALSAGLLL